ncbi:hypothetical protein C0J52_19255 [Blattella germanica]|nr:hypothetical protein C0J52_19255 [Blattella germanica]
MAHKKLKICTWKINTFYNMKKKIISEINLFIPYFPVYKTHFFCMQGSNVSLVTQLFFNFFVLCFILLLYAEVTFRRSFSRII